MVHVDETFGELETGETAAHGVAERRERCSPHSLSARHGCGATRDGGSDSDLGIRPPDPAQFEERGRENHGEAASWLVFGSFQGVLTCWDFRTPCVRTCLRRAISTPRPSWSVVRASLTLCMLLLRAISARAQVAFGRWILDDPFPQFRSHGRINVTGSGNLGHDRQALAFALCRSRNCSAKHAIYR